MTAEVLEAFVLDAARRLGLEGSVDSFGVSRIVRCSVGGRAADLGTNGSFYWVAADLAWPLLPRDAEIAWAPEDTYDRAKLLEEGPVPPQTGDARFDQIYLLLGAGAAGLARVLSQSTRDALVQCADIHPHVTWLDLSPVRPRLHIRAQPPVRSDYRLPWPALGTAGFTSERAAAALERAVGLAERIERSFLARE